MMDAFEEARKQRRELQAALKQKLVEWTEKLVAHGGPAAVTVKGRVCVHDEPGEPCCWDGLLGCCQGEETYYPLWAVLDAIGCLGIHTLQEAWNEVLGKEGTLPVYLHCTADGHYTAMMAETVVLRQLIELTDEYNAVMMAE
jgi:hypothetical protein